MKESFLLDSGTWSIGDKPEQADYDGLVHVLEDGVWEIEVEYVPVWAWTSRANMPGIRNNHTGCGTTNAALSFLGESQYQVYAPETFHYNGTSWTTGADNNNARSNACSTGTTDAALVWGGYRVTAAGGPSDTDGWYNDTDHYDGATWSGRQHLPAPASYQGGCGTTTDALNLGGYSSSENAGRATCLHYDGMSWSPGGEPITPRRYEAACGTPAAAISFGGYIYDGTGTYTEHYNGVSWSPGEDLNYSHIHAAGCGATDAAFCFGDGEFTEHYDGASWSVGAALPPKQGAEGAGTTTSALSFGGSGGFSGAPQRSTEEYAEVQMKTTGPSRMVNPSGGNSNEQNTQ